MADKQESSVLFSLNELMRLEEDRSKAEVAHKAAAAKAAEEARAAAERAKREEEERLRRWRLVLGGPAAEATGVDLSGTDLGMDTVLAALYDTEKDQRRVGMGPSMPNVSRWLGDIRTYFPSSTVRVMQQDAIDRRLRLTPVPR